LSPAQQWALLVLVSSHLDTLAHSMFQRGLGATAAADSLQAVAQLERLDLLKRHGAAGDGQPFVTLTREGFMAAFDLYTGDIAADGGEGCL
jgi:hypothetical protein